MKFIVVVPTFLHRDDTTFLPLFPKDLCGMRQDHRAYAGTQFQNVLRLGFHNMLIERIEFEVRTSGAGRFRHQWREV